MPPESFNISAPKPCVLVVPLDWGLGHATRCIPIIRELLHNGCKVLIGAKGPIKLLLAEEFSEISFLSINNYNIRYSSKKKGFSLIAFLQIPKLFFAIYKEHNWLKKAIKKYDVTAIISDNRLGLYNSSIATVYITHQLLIKTGNKFTENIVRKIHYRFIKKYAACWVPDFNEKNTLAGELSHPENLLSNTFYIGSLSRFEKKPVAEKKYNLLFLLSGPEPSRTIFEKILLKELKDYNGKVLFIRGLPGDHNLIKSNNPRIKIINHLAADELNLAMEESELVICRSGYTTIMDLVKLQKKAILIPTPGQTEQEYLAAHLLKQKMFFSVERSYQRIAKLSFCNSHV